LFCAAIYQWIPPVCSTVSLHSACLLLRWFFTMMELHRAVIHRDGTRLVLVVLDYNNSTLLEDELRELLCILMLFGLLTGSLK